MCVRKQPKLRALGSLHGNYFVYMWHNGACRIFYFEESGAVYICIARYNKYVNFWTNMILRFTHFTFM